MVTRLLLRYSLMMFGALYFAIHGESWRCIGYTMVGRWFCTLSQTIATVCHCDISFILCWKLEAFQVQWLQSIARNSLLMDQTCSDAFLGSRSHYESRENRPCLTFAGKRSACWSPGNSFLGPTPIVCAKFANCLIALPHCSQSILVGRIPMFCFFLNRHILLAESPYFVAYESTCFLLNLRVLLSNSPFLMRTYITWWICFVSCKPSFLVEHPLWISISIRLNLSCLNPVSCVVSSCFLAKSPHFLCVVSPYFDAYIAMFKDESRCLSMLNLCWANVRTLVSLL